MYPTLACTKIPGIGGPKKGTHGNKSDINNPVGRCVDPGRIKGRQAGKHGLVKVVIDGLGARTGSEMKAFGKVRRDFRHIESRSSKPPGYDHDRERRAQTGSSAVHQSPI